MAPLQRLVAFRHDRSAAAAAEMALVTPLLLTLLLGAVELGKYFLDVHVVSKAVRDGARYAARQTFTDYPACSPSATLIANTRNLTRTGQVASGGSARLDYWTDGISTVNVSSTCTTGTYSGIYSDLAMGAPVVEVSATVDYVPLVAAFGFDATGLKINAQSQSPVTGI